MRTKAATYLDFNAGNPLHSEVVRALSDLLSGRLANPSSIHSHGRQAKKLLAEARENIAASLGSKTDPEQIIFTSSGTEANQLAIRSALIEALKTHTSPIWLLSPTEHHSTLQMVEWFRAQGGIAEFIPVDINGIPKLDALEILIQQIDRTKLNIALISTMWVNNETGAITDITAISNLTKQNKIRLHIDAAQAWGKLAIDVNSMGADYVTFSGHKIGALAGTGMLWINRGVPIHSLVYGLQEKGRRGGTENLLGIVSMGIAAKILDPVAWARSVTAIREDFETEIVNSIPGTTINAKNAPRVANTTSLSFDSVEGESLSMALDLEGYSVSAGSACSSGVLEPSHVLMAMGKSKPQALASIRVSIHPSVAFEDLKNFTQTLSKVVQRSRNLARPLEH
jgi:cysteine desulfurase